MTTPISGWNPLLAAGTRPLGALQPASVRAVEPSPGLAAAEASHAGTLAETPCAALLPADEATLEVAAAVDDAALASAATVETCDAPAASTEATAALLRSHGVADSASGTLTTLKDFSPFSHLVSGPADLEAAARVPTTYGQREIEGLYFTTGDAATAKGLEGLTQEGLEVYATVRARFLDAAPKCPFGSPTLYLTGGLPGSGKGFVLKRIMGDDPQFVLVDPDEIKKHIVRDLAERNPGLIEQMEGRKDWADHAHETSSYMAKLLMDEALGSGKDIVFDSSMATANIDKYRKYAKRAADNGYKVTGLITQVSVDTSVQRALKRAERPTEVTLEDGTVMNLPGRLVRAEKIEECAGYLDHNLSTYLGEALYDTCVVFDNSSDANPARVDAVWVKVTDADGHPRMERRSVFQSPFQSSAG